MSPSADDGGRAPSGIRGPRRRFEAPDPYEQIFRATAKAVAEEGYEQASVESICALSGLSPELFRTYFESKQEAVLRAVEEFADRVIGDCTAAVAAANSWPEEIWAMSTALTDWCACEPCFARLWFIEMGGAGEPARKLMGELLDTLAMFLDPGYEQLAGTGLEHGSLDKEVGDWLNVVLSEHIQRHSARTLPRVAPELARVALTPFIGDAEARRFVEERLAEERKAR